MLTRIVLSLYLLFFLTNPAYAYIDPGSGSALMSAFVGLFVASGLAIKTYWYKLKALLLGKKDSPQETQTSNENDAKPQ